MRKVSKKNKYLKLTLFGKLFLMLVIIAIAFFINVIINKYINKKEDSDNKPIINDYNTLNNKDNEKDKNSNSEENVNNIQVKLIDIVDTSESDKEVVNKMFATGMDLTDFKNIVNKKRNYIKKNGQYIKNNYNFDKKLHYSEIESILLNLNNSDIVKLEVIGISVDNRNIYGIEVGKGDKVIFIDANIHAAEIASTLMLLKYLNEVVDLYENGNQNIIDSLNTYKLAIIPSINPDGYEIYNYGVDALNNKDLWWYQNKNKYDFENMKSNANGVDINRNFPVQNAGLYFKDKKLINSVSLEKTTKTTAYFGGTSLGSEPETRAAMYFMLNHYQNTVKYMNMHSQGRVIYAGKPNLSSEFNNLTTSFAKNVSKINNYTVYGLESEEVGEGNDGSATDFMAELANGFAFSSVTGRLSTDKHKNNSCKLIYSYPVITIETIKTYTTSPSVFKTEYYDKKIRNVLFSLIDYKI